MSTIEAKALIALSVKYPGLVKVGTISQALSILRRAA